MHPYLFLPSVFLIATAIPGVTHTEPQHSSVANKIILHAVNHRMVNSRFGKTDDFAAKMVARDFFAIGRDGAWLDRQAYIDRVRDTSEPVEVYYDDVRLQGFAKAAIVQAVASVVSPDGSVQHIRYSDVYVRENIGWQLASSQETLLGLDTPIAPNSAAVPGHKTWQGTNPTGDDLTILRALNDHYVNAFREANVGWFDAHLAPTYMVTFGDGSFHNRDAALADFAIPYFAETMKSFPVENVTIRLFEDIAIINAENDYRLRDGRKGINRYTDIWQKIDGRWLCLSAHITVHKAASL